MNSLLVRDSRWKSVVFSLVLHYDFRWGVTGSPKIKVSQMSFSSLACATLCGVLNVYIGKPKSTLRTAAGALRFVRKKKTKVKSRRIVHSKNAAKSPTKKLHVLGAHPPDQKRIHSLRAPKARAEKFWDFHTETQKKIPQYVLKTAQNTHESQNAARSPTRKLHIFGAHPD